MLGNTSSFFDTFSTKLIRIKPDELQILQDQPATTLFIPNIPWQTLKYKVSIATPHSIQAPHIEILYVPIVVGSESRSQPRKESLWHGGSMSHKTKRLTCVCIFSTTRTQPPSPLYSWQSIWQTPQISCSHCRNHSFLSLLHAPSDPKLYWSNTLQAFKSNKIWPQDPQHNLVGNDDNVFGSCAYDYNVGPFINSKHIQTYSNIFFKIDLVGVEYGLWVATAVFLAQ